VRYITDSLICGLRSYILDLRSYITHSLIFGLRAYWICFIYLIASTISVICAALRFVFAPFVFDEKFQLHGIFNELGAVEYFAFGIAHSIMLNMREHEDTKEPEHKE
jgi:hypothetical protein